MARSLMLAGPRRYPTRHPPDVASGGGPACGKARQVPPTSGPDSTRGRFLVMLGLPSFALSLAVTTVSGLLPVLVAAQAGPLVAGALVAVEGVFALTVPLVVGPKSDRTGHRLPYLAIAGAVAGAALALIGLTDPLLLTAALAMLFYVAYFAYMTAYYAIFPEVVDEDVRGRSQGSLGTWREVGLGVGFVVGPALLSLWRPAPFVLAAAWNAARPSRRSCSAWWSSRR